MKALEDVVGVLEDENEKMEKCRAECAQLTNKSLPEEEFKRPTNIMYAQYRTRAPPSSDAILPG